MARPQHRVSVARPALILSPPARSTEAMTRTCDWRLLEAAERGDAKAVRRHLTQGADVNARRKVAGQ